MVIFGADAKPPCPWNVMYEKVTNLLRREIWHNVNYRHIAEKSVELYRLNRKIATSKDTVTISEVTS